jgi:hypothetical protein
MFFFTYFTFYYYMFFFTYFTFYYHMVCFHIFYLLLLYGLFSYISGDKYNGVPIYVLANSTVLKKTIQLKTWTNKNFGHSRNFNLLFWSQWNTV